MRKHHNKLYFGKYTHKAVFDMPWAYKLYPTSVLHLQHWAKDDHYPLAKTLAQFILANRDNLKFRIQTYSTIFYSDKQTIIKTIDLFWKQWKNIHTVDPQILADPKQDVILCRRLPLGKYKYQVWVNRKLCYRLSESQRERLNQYLSQNEDTAICTNKHLSYWLAGGTSPYGQPGYFYIKDDKALMPLYLISDQIVDRLVKFVKIKK